MIRLPDPCLVVLVGAPGAGKSYWASEWFQPNHIVSSDQLRAVVGLGEHDQRASKDAFVVLDLIVERRLRRKLTTVIDSTALEADRRRHYREAAAKANVPVFAIVFDTPHEVCRARNKDREQPVPPKILEGQLEMAAALRGSIEREGFDAVHVASAVTVVRPEFLHAPQFAAKQKESPMPLEFGIHVSRFNGELADVARAAEEAGFTQLSVMDHFVQIPGVGREWEDMLESYTTLGFLAGVTSTMRLGTLVTGITYRNLAHLGKIVATLDVLSNGRAFCGVGAAWFAREHQLYGWEFPPVGQRYALLEDALQLLPLLWGKGSPPFEGRTISIPEAICYPRPVQDRIPIMIGGSGERRTLKLVAQYADACNLFGDAATVRHKIEVLTKHCTALDRDPAEITITQLSSPGSAPVDDEIGRYRELAESGVQQAIVSLDTVEAIERFAPVITAFAR
ncbi:MAG TPA: TIGR03560 family F420-dependent LLM class oxidoreductase [Acidimicrobiales bacterium]|nr:TIGR03560 family F420-dependent LLM class oxidoreductase [Acidimicrobiales bacterium]